MNTQTDSVQGDPAFKNGPGETYAINFTEAIQRNKQAERVYPAWRIIYA
jgi:hypothetical protein